MSPLDPGLCTALKPTLRLPWTGPKSLLMGAGAGDSGYRPRVVWEKIQNMKGYTRATYLQRGYLALFYLLWVIVLKYTSSFSLAWSWTFTAMLGLSAIIMFARQYSWGQVEQDGYVLTTKIPGKPPFKLEFLLYVFVPLVLTLCVWVLHFTATVLE